MVFKGEHKKASNSIARLKKNGKVFEIIIDSEKAINYKQGKSGINDALLVENIFKDAQKGDLAGDLEKDFQTDDVIKIAEEIILKGEIQLTEEYRKKVLEEKTNEVINELTSKASDPTTKLPVPKQRIELGITKAGYKIRYEKSSSEQVKELMDLLPKVMIVTFKEIMVTITSPVQYTAQVFSIAKKSGEVIGQNIMPDGSLVLTIKATASSKSELSDKLKSLSHGLIKIKEE